jgi:hypothetical protein
MAIEGLARLAASVDDGSDRLFRVLEAQPEPALRVEAVKALLELDPNTAGRIKDLLPEQLHFALDLRRAKVEEVDVEPEREETNERLARPPRFDQPATSPTIRGGSEASW